MVGILRFHLEFANIHLMGLLVGLASLDEFGG